MTKGRARSRKRSSWICVRGEWVTLSWSQKSLLGPEWDFLGMEFHPLLSPMSSGNGFRFSFSQAEGGRRWNVGDRVIKI